MSLSANRLTAALSAAIGGSSNAMPWQQLPPAAPTTAAAAPALEGAEPLPGSPEALLLLAGLGVAPAVAGGQAAADPRFAPEAIRTAIERWIALRQRLEQLGQEQKQIQELLRLAHLRGDLLQQLPAGPDGNGYLVGTGLALIRRSGRRQWRYSTACQELDCQLKARQGYEQSSGEARCSLGPAFWELRSLKG